MNLRIDQIEELEDAARKVVLACERFTADRFINQGSIAIEQAQNVLDVRIGLMRDALGRLPK